LRLLGEKTHDDSWFDAFFSPSMIALNKVRAVIPVLEDPDVYSISLWYMFGWMSFQPQ
jgi:hypothetical protein